MNSDTPLTFDDIEKAIAELGPPPPSKLRVNPADIVALKLLIASDPNASIGPHGTVFGVELIPDPAVSRGEPKPEPTVPADACWPQRWPSFSNRYLMPYIPTE